MKSCFWHHRFIRKFMKRKGLERVEF